jgi:hypothetical protein
MAIAPQPLNPQCNAIQCHRLSRDLKSKTHVRANREIDVSSTRLVGFGFERNRRIASPMVAMPYYELAGRGGGDMDGVLESGNDI